VTEKRPTGMLGFTVVWIGQIFSLLGTSMTGFAMTIWAYQKTESATALALVGFFFLAPMLIATPFTGALVDRWNRKLMMMLSDLASGAATILILILYTSGHLEIWHLYLTGAMQGIFQSFQWPAYSAAISTMISKEHYGRANGMLSLAETGSNIFAPILAGALLGIIGIGGILTIDLATLSIAVAALLVVHVPQPKISAEGREAQGSLLKEAGYGFRYIFKRPPLLALQSIFMIGNFLYGIPMAVVAALILASTNNNEQSLALVNSVGAIGGVIGGLAMSAWGGPKRRVYGVLGGWLASSLLGLIVMGLGRSPYAWAVAAFFGTFFVPIINGSNQAIWQAKVPPDLQGKVFSIRRLIAWFVSPAAMLIAGPLADKVLEPAMRLETSPLATSIGWLVGTGPGRGMALMFLVGGILTAGVTLFAFSIPLVRRAEDLLPDFDTISPDEEEQEQERQSRLQELMEQRQNLLTQPPTDERDQALLALSEDLHQLGQPGD
jgi:DHA3 family macrolide efflux protein-like MFS transporter